MAVNFEPIKNAPQPPKAQEAPAKPVERPSDKAKAAAAPPPAENDEPRIRFACLDRATRPGIVPRDA